MFIRAIRASFRRTLCGFLSSDAAALAAWLCFTFAVSFGALWARSCA